MTVESLSGFVINATSRRPHVNLYIALLENYETQTLLMAPPKPSRRQIPSATKNKIIGFLEVEKNFAKASRKYDASAEPDLAIECPVVLYSAVGV